MTKKKFHISWESMKDVLSQTGELLKKLAGQLQHKMGHRWSRFSHCDTRGLTITLYHLKHSSEASHGWNKQGERGPPCQITRGFRCPRVPLNRANKEDFDIQLWMWWHRRREKPRHFKTSISFECLKYTIFAHVLNITF